MKRTLISFLLLFLVYVAPSYSRLLINNKDSIRCTVLALIKTDLLKNEQSKKDREGRFVSKYSIIALPFGQDNPKVYFLDDYYDFDFYSLQAGDTVCLHFVKFNNELCEVAISFTNESFLKRTSTYGSDFIDIDFWEVEKRANESPVFDDGLFLKWAVSKERFMKYIVEDSLGFRRLDIKDESELFLSERLLFQLYSIYISGHNETLRNRKE